MLRQDAGDPQIAAAALSSLTRENLASVVEAALTPPSDIAGPVMQAGVDKAKPMVKAGVERAKPMVQAGMDRARPVLEKARDSGAALARRSAEAVMAAGRKGAAVGGDEQKQLDPGISDPLSDQ